MKEKKNIKRRKLNDKGSAIVFVVVIMALMGILVTMALYMCVSNFYMKANDLQSKNNLYSAEAVLDEIKAGIQQQASAAVDVAYMNVVQNYEVFSDNDEARTDEFVYHYVTQLRNYYKLNDDTHYDIEKLKAYVKSVKQISDIRTEQGALISINGAADQDNIMVAYETALVFKNVSVKYRDSKGYVSMISTDIRVGIPEISFDSGLTIPEIISYSLIANEKLDITEGNNATISGSVYGGRQGIVASKGSTGMYFKGSELIITPNLVTADDTAVITVDKDSSLWAGGTLVDRAATLNLLGNAYIEDDTTVDGNSSSLNIQGKYMGFGNELQKAEKSSSIIINGVGSKVNLSSVERLLLPGNAYIGVEKGKDKIEMSSTLTLHNNDIGLGESMTAKASQIAYLVPSECIGYVDGECVLGSNPVLYSKYKSAYADVADDDDLLVDYSKISNNGTDYGKEYGATYRTKFVSIDNGTGNAEALVYFYIAFEDTKGTQKELDQENAAKFFKDYFSENEENIRRYLDIYIDTLDVNEDDIFRLNIAGNMLSKVNVTDEDGNPVMEEVEVTDEDGNKTKKIRQATKYELITETQTADNAAGIDYSTEVEAYKNVFTSLVSKLAKEGAEQSEIDEVLKLKDDGSGQYEGKGIFENLIDRTAFEFIVDSVEANSEYTNPDGTKVILDREARFDNAAEGVKAIVVDNAYYGSVYELGTSTPTTTSLLIASGDVKITREFKGTVIAGGNITIACGGAENNNTVEIDHDRDMVRHVLDVENTFTARDGSGTQKQCSPMTLFKTGAMKISNPGNSKDAETKGDIVIEDLVTYQNWTKE